MDVDFLYHSATGRGTADAPPRPGRAGPTRPGKGHIDWNAAQQAGRACCCSAKPAVIAVMPPVKGRRHSTELLLCGHHYRASKQALAAAGATVWDMTGAPVTDDAWALAGGAWVAGDAVTPAV